MSRRFGHSAHLVLATVVVAALSFGAAWSATLPLPADPFSMRALVFMLTFAVVCMVGLSASEPFIRRSARRRARKSRG